jgi:hypothetical protein
MNIVFLGLLFNIINFVLINCINHQHKFNYNRFALRCIIFKEKKISKIMKKIKNYIEIYHNKSIVTLAEGITTYNDLSEDEKTLIESIISFCY